MSLKSWWQRVTREEYELILTVPKDVTVHADGTRTESTKQVKYKACLLYTSPSPRDRTRSRMPSSA